MTDKWKIRFMQHAEQIASWSKDPRRKVGCVIVDDDYNILSGGYNGFPRKIKDDFRLEDKVAKNRIIVHAEANAVASAARNGHSVKNGNVFISNFPCMQCAGLLIQAGVKAIYCKWDTTFTPTDETNFELLAARKLVVEADVDFDEITLEFMKHAG